MSGGGTAIFARACPSDSGWRSAAGQVAGHRAAWQTTREDRIAYDLKSTLQRSTSYPRAICAAPDVLNEFIFAPASVEASYIVRISEQDQRSPKVCFSTSGQPLRVYLQWEKRRQRPTRRPEPSGRWPWHLWHHGIHTFSADTGSFCSSWRVLSRGCQHMGIW